MTEIDDRVIAQVRNVVGKLHEEMSSAFTNAQDKSVNHDKNGADALELTEYLLKLKEKELSKANSKELSHEHTILTLVQLCKILAKDRSDIKEIIRLLSDIVDAGVILWTQNGTHYTIVSSDENDNDNEAAKFFISLLPVLSNESTPMPGFKKGLQHYLVYTDDHTDDIKALLFVKFQKQFTPIEENMAQKLSELIFSLKNYR